MGIIQGNHIRRFVKIIKDGEVIVSTANYKYLKDEPNRVILVDIERNIFGTCEDADKKILEKDSAYDIKFELFHMESSNSVLESVNGYIAKNYLLTAIYTKYTPDGDKEIEYVFVRRIITL